jgi:hypothetical protein
VAPHRPARTAASESHIWSIGELIDAATTTDDPCALAFSLFTVIQGGRE